jgi:trk system potassium uptake protein TrkA
VHVVIVGCGRSGSALATRLDAGDATVSVIDHDTETRRHLPAPFRGSFVLGDALRKAVLDEAGIGRADAFVAVSSNDNLNIVVARVARDVFHVPKVLGRLHDVEWAPIGDHLGLQMVTTVQTTVDRLHLMLQHRPLDPEQVFGNGESLLVRSSVPDYLAGRPISEFNVEGEIQVVELSRGGHSTIPGVGTTLRDGDVVSFIVASSALERLKGFLGGSWDR